MSLNLQNDNVTLCEFAVTWSAQTAIHNVLFIQLMSNDESVKARCINFNPKQNKIRE